MERSKNMVQGLEFTTRFQGSPGILPSILVEFSLSIPK
jgi:hypothetical protein